MKLKARVRKALAFILSLAMVLTVNGFSGGFNGGFGAIKASAEYEIIRTEVHTTVIENEDGTTTDVPTLIIDEELTAAYARFVFKFSGIYIQPGETGDKTYNITAIDGEECDYTIEITYVDNEGTAYSVNEFEAGVSYKTFITVNGDFDGFLESDDDAKYAMNIDSNVAYEQIGLFTPDSSHQRVQGGYTFTCPSESINENIDVNILNDEGIETSYFEYTGYEVTPEIEIYSDMTELVEGTDYKLEFKNNIDAGTATVIITGIGNYYGTIQDTFEIEKALYDAAEVEVVDSIGDAGHTYTGSEIKPDITVYFEGRELRDDEYTVTYENNIDAGEASVYINMLNYIDWDSETEEAIYKYDFEINPIQINTTNTTVSGEDEYEYTGEEIKPDITVKYGDVELVEDQDYTITYSSVAYSGTRTATITGIGNYSGPLYFEYEIVAKALKEEDLTITGNTTYSYTGSKVIPDVSVAYGDTKLKASYDYTLEADSDASVGSKTATIIGIGNYSFSATFEYNVFYDNVNKLDIQGISTYGYLYNDGEEIKPETTLTYDGTELVEGKDYEVSYANNKEVGTGEITFTGLGDYAFTTTRTFSIIDEVKDTIDNYTVGCASADLSSTYILSEGDTVEGLTWDKDSHTLTLSDYNGGPIFINRIDNGIMGETVDFNIVVKGNNTIDYIPGSDSDSGDGDVIKKSPSLYEYPTLMDLQGNYTMSGDGTLNFECEKSNAIGGVYSLSVFGNLNIDGPTIIVNNSNISLIVDADNIYEADEDGVVSKVETGGLLKLISGNIAFYPIVLDYNSSKGLNRYVTSVMYTNYLELAGGNIYIKAPTYDEDVSVSAIQNCQALILAKNTITTDEVTVYLDKTGYNVSVNLFGSESGDTVTIGENTTIINEWDGVIKKDAESSESPDASTDPGASEVPSGSADPSGSENPDASASPSGSEVPSGSAVPGSSASPSASADPSASPSESAETTVKKGTSFKVGNYKYKVTKAGSTSSTGEVQLVGATKKTLKTVKVAKTVKYNGVTFKVTSIKANAFKKFAKLKKVTIGANITKINKNAFFGCKKLKNVIIKSTAIKTFGKGAFKNSAKKITFKLPKKKKAVYKTKIKKSGVSKQAKYK
ncbi:MAG: leucine-rich repeat protein [Lachnospiraceae bacterium]|nr:leucine-rich repeat protein [Lachnospiraceae bacterium]